MAVFDLITTPGADGKLDERLMLYGQFVGSWKVLSTWFDENGAQRQATGEWHFDWILDGQGVQDVLFADNYPRAKYGTTLRCYDSSIDAWRISWMQPGNGEFANLIGRKRGDEIVQELLGITDRKENWIFKNIGRNDFTWIAESSVDGGKTWKLLQEMKCRRF